MEKEISITELLGLLVRAVWKRRLFCGALVALITGGTLLYSLTLPPVYQSEAVIMPIQPGGGGGTAAGLSAMVLPFVGSGLGGGNNTLLMILESRALRERVARALNWVPATVPGTAGNDTPEEFAVSRAVDRLSRMVRVKNDRIFIERISITVDSNDAMLSAKIARQYLVELQNYLSSNSLTQAKRSRLFLEAQAARSKEELLEMGKTLAAFYRENTISAVQAKVNVPIGILTGTDVRNFKSYEEFKQHFDILQQPNADAQGEAKQVKYVRDVPQQIYLKYLSLQQTVLEQQYASLIQSHQAALLEESKQEPSFQILDEPRQPQYRVGPQRRRIGAGAFLVSIVIAVAVATYKEFQGVRSVATTIRDSRWSAGGV